MKHTFPARLRTASLGLVAASSLTSAASAQDYLGTIIQVGFTFCPLGTISAEGQLLAINQNQSLYSLFGTTYGGDGRTTFALPDLRGRSPMSQGTGPGLPTYTLGQRGGAETRPLTLANLPAHSHAVNANNLDGDKAGPGGKLLAAAPTGGTGNETIYSNQPPTVQMSAEMISTAGSGQSFSTLDPAIVIRYCVVTQGLFPPRN